MLVTILIFLKKKKKKIRRLCLEALEKLKSEVKCFLFFLLLLFFF